MLSSLGIGENRYQGLQLAPPGTGGSFLTLGTAPPMMASSSLAALLQRAAPAPLPVLRPVPQAIGVSNLSQFDLRHYSLGRFTAETVRNMHRGVLAAKTDPTWRAEMLRHRQLGREHGLIGWKDYLGEARYLDQLFRHGGGNFIDYVRDPQQVELVKHPWLTYSGKEGDCDDSSTMFAAACGVLGAPHRFVTWKADPSRPHEWSHVTSEIYVPGEGWLNQDLTVRGAHFGWKPAGFETAVWPEPTY